MELTSLSARWLNFSGLKILPMKSRNFPNENTKAYERYVVGRIQKGMRSSWSRSLALLLFLAAAAAAAAAAGATAGLSKKQNKTKQNKTNS